MALETVARWPLFDRNGLRTYAQRHNEITLMWQHTVTDIAHQNKLISSPFKYSHNSQGWHQVWHRQNRSVKIIFTVRIR